LLVLVLTLLLPLIAGCEGAVPSGDPLLTANAEEWRLEQDLDLDGEFGKVTSLAVDSRGNVYVADAMNHRVDVFAPDGRRIGAIGRRGEGPGEFRTVTHVAVSRGDTLFVFDAQAQRVTRFAGLPDGTLAGTISVRRPDASANYQVLVTERAGLLVPYTVPLTEANADSARTLVLRHLTGDRYAEASTVIEVPDREFLISRDPRFGLAIGSLPYGREPLLRLGPDDVLHYAWTDRLAIETYDLSGQRRGRVAFEHRPEPVSDEEIARLLDSYRPDALSQVERSLMERAHGDGRLPATKPAIRNLLVDDAGRTWANLVKDDDVMIHTGAGMDYVPPGPDAESPWVIIGAAGEIVARTSLPHGTSLRVVRDGLAYGVATDAGGEQRVVRYRVPAPRAP
jgi:hypothetical protein